MEFKFRPGNSLIVFLLGWLGLVSADNHTSNGTNLNAECISHLIELAGLVKQYNGVVESVIDQNTSLQALQLQGDDIGDDERIQIESIENMLQNLEQEKVVRLVALNSKSDRVLRHCSE